MNEDIISSKLVGLAEHNAGLICEKLGIADEDKVRLVEAMLVGMLVDVTKMFGRWIEEGIGGDEHV